MKEKNKGSTTSNFFEKADKRIQDMKAYTNKNPENSRADAVKTLESMGLSKDGKLKSQIVYWS